ncbi:MAG: hypothetical protein LBU58_00905 [Clostridiales bacterium]|jgi:hypothetical protein|nr:hypothetical protein [Clostridiales bacterium]
MTAKEQLLNVLDFVGEQEAKLILLYAKETFALKPKTWDDIEEVEPSLDEVAAFEEYRAAKTQNT